FPRASIPVCLTATPPAPLHPLSLHDALPILIYYRLKIVDNDGATTFSKIVSIEYQGSLAFSISPNPATNKIIVRGNNITRVEIRSEEHTSELQSRENLVCRLLLEKKNTEQPK